MDKSPEAFRTISEVAETLETPAHVLRFWETRFPQIRPVKRAGGRRYYRPSDVALLSGIKRLLHDEGLTIRGVQKILREQGIRHVAALGSGQPMAEDDGQTIEAELSAALGPGTEETLPAAEAESAQVIALETVLARADRTPPPVQPGLWDDPVDSSPDEAAETDDAADPAPEAPMVEMAEPEPAEPTALFVTEADTAPATVPETTSGTDGAGQSAGGADDAGVPAAEGVADAAPDTDSAPSLPAGPVPAEPESAPVESEPAVESATAASRLRALPRGALADRADAVAELQDRILTLRSRLAEAAGRRVR